MAAFNSGVGAREELRSQILRQLQTKLKHNQLLMLQQQLRKKLKKNWQHGLSNEERLELWTLNQELAKK